MVSKPDKKLRVISIHTLRVEGDDKVNDLADSMIEFQSTPSAWRVTSALIFPLMMPLRFQSTPSAWRVTLEYWPCYNSYIKNFNPHPPRGG